MIQLGLENCAHCLGCGLTFAKGCQEGGGDDDLVTVGGRTDWGGVRLASMESYSEGLS